MDRSSGPSLDGQVSHEGFLTHARFFYLKLAIVLNALTVLAYALDKPPSGPGGGTPLGYALGGLGAVLILWLAWLGIRRRNYRSRIGSTRGWTSAHVYLGLSLIVIVSLHCAFQFGWNVHTLAYVLMLAVIGSGLYGILAYARYPRRITSNRAGSSDRTWYTELLALDDQALKLADAIGPDIHEVLVRSVERREIGGGLHALLFGAGGRRPAVVDPIQRSLTRRLVESAGLQEIFDPSRHSTISIMADELAAGGRSEAASARIQALLDILARRRDITLRLNRDIRMHARMRIWLFVHVPMTFALMAALIAHVFSVFFYW